MKNRHENGVVSSRKNNKKKKKKNKKKKKKQQMAIVNSETAGIITREQIALPDNLRLMVRDTPNSMESLIALGEVLAPGNFLLRDGGCDRYRRRVRKVHRELHGRLSQTARRGVFDGVLGVVRWRGDKRPLFAKIAADRQIVAVGDDETLMVTAGVYLLPTAIFAFAENARSAQLSALRRFLIMLIDNGMRFGAVEMADVIDVDEAADLAAARVAVEVRR